MRRFLIGFFVGALGCAPMTRAELGPGDDRLSMGLRLHRHLESRVEVQVEGAQSGAQQLDEAFVREEQMDFRVEVQEDTSLQVEVESHQVKVEGESSGPNFKGKEGSLQWLSDEEGYQAILEWGETGAWDDWLLELPRDLRTAFIFKKLEEGESYRVGDKWQIDWEKAYLPGFYQPYFSGSYDLEYVEDVEFHGRRAARLKFKGSLAGRVAEGANLAMSLEEQGEMLYDHEERVFLSERLEGEYRVKEQSADDEERLISTTRFTYQSETKLLKAAPEPEE